MDEIKKDVSNIRINDTCPACGQTIDTTHLEKLKADLEDQLNTKTTLHLEGMTKADKWSNEIKLRIKRMLIINEKLNVLKPCSTYRFIFTYRASRCKRQTLT